MKHLGKYILTLIIVTGGMLLFVHQQISIIKCSYSINTHEQKLARLKENHKNLTFQLASCTSPAKMNQKLAAAEIDLVFPDEITIVRVPSSSEQPIRLAESSEAASSQDFSILRILGFERQAQAELPAR